MRRLLLGCLLGLLAFPAAAAAHDDPVGDHEDTVQELSGVDVVSDVGQARLRALDVGVSATTLPTTWCGTATTADDTVDATFDRTLPQFKVIYAYPADRPNRFAQWQDALQTDVSLIEQFVSSQPGSVRAPRFDMGTSCGPQYLDIQTVALPNARAAYVQSLNAVETYVKTQVNPSPGGRRDYLIIADTLSSGGANGVGELYEGSTASQRPDVTNVHNDGGLTSVMWVPDAAAPGSNPNGWWPEGLLHEMTHNIGGVQWGSPHSSQPAGGTNYTYSHCWDGRDVMCYQDGPAMSQPYSATVCAALSGAMPQTYDCGQDDYFNPAPPAGSYLATHWDVYNSVFLADCSTLPAGTCLSSGPTDPPANTAPPTIAGTPATGETLTGSRGTWSPAGVSYGYQWLRDGGIITGATASTYKLATADSGALITLRVTAISPYGAVSATSDPVGPVAARPPVNTAPPTISGAATSGALLSATTGAWSPAGTSYQFQWMRDGADVPGATLASYRVPVTDKGALLQVRVAATNAEGTARAYSGSVGPVVVPTPVNTRAPAIIGAAKTGVTLVATTGTWEPGAPGYALQWQRDTGSGFADVAGARSSTLRLGTADRNASIRLRVTAISGDVAVTAYSAALGPVAAQPPVNIGLPKVTGPGVVGTTLSGTAGTWSPAGTSYSYQWERGGAAIAGATRGAYRLTAADQGARLQLRVVATNADGTASARSLVVGPIPASAALATVRAGSSGAVRSPSGTVLASATVSGAAASAAAVHVRTLTVTVRRSAHAHGRLKVAACGQTCAVRRLGRRAVLKVDAPSGRVQVALIRS